MSVKFADGTAVDATMLLPNVEGDDIEDCILPSFSEIGLQIAKDEGIYDPNAPMSNFSEDVEELYFGVKDEMNEIIRLESLYSTLIESTYLDGAFDNMGHSYDNLDELAASTINILISFPDEFAENIKDLPEDQQDAVIAVVRTVVDEIARTNPELADFMHEREATLIEAIRR
jgi:hypothetical protein